MICFVVVSFHFFLCASPVNFERLQKSWREKPLARFLQRHLRRGETEKQRGDGRQLREKRAERTGREQEGEEIAVIRKQMAERRERTAEKREKTAIRRERA